MLSSFIEVLNQLLTKTSVMGAVISIALLVGIAILAYYAKESIDLKRRESEQRLHILNRESEDKEIQQKALTEEVRQSRVQMIDHLNRDRREKDRLTRTLGSMAAEFRAQVKVLDGLKTALDRHCEKCAERSERLKDEILKRRE